jgi:uncharacterized protein YbdZ (MbtH family)/predicted MFS family arabinose efflux permease
MTPDARNTPLSRNRDYRLLWSSLALSEFGGNASTIAFPLLVLAVTGSPAASGAVLAALAAGRLVAGLPAGALVDRWNRKHVMLACEATAAIAAGSLAVALWWRVPTVPHMVAVAAIFGVCAALTEPAEDASVPRLVPADQVSTAVAMNSARAYLGNLAGTAAGGFLFALGRVVPFVVDTASHLAAVTALVFLRLPPASRDPEHDSARGPDHDAERVEGTDEQPAVNAPAARGHHLGREIADGLRWVWGHRQIRVTAACAVMLNLFFAAFYVVVIVLAQRRGVPPGQIGVMAAMLGVGGVVGALCAPRLRRWLSPYASILATFWALTVLTPVAVLAGNAVLLGALFFAMALLPPTANTAIMTGQLLATPDALRGRLSSVVGLVASVAAAAGPVLGGALMQAVPGTRAVLLCAAGMAAASILVTVSPTLRTFTQANDSASEGESTVDDDAQYEVLRNDEDQYSLWLAGHEVPAGWHQVGKQGTKDECSAYVDEVWTDMRPRSLREFMERSASS